MFRSPRIGIGIGISTRGGGGVEFQSAEVGTVGANSLVMTYNKSLDESSVPATSDFVVNDGSPNAVTNVAVLGKNVTLTLTNNVVSGDTVVLSYTAGANPIQDVAGNNAANLTTESVTNNV